MVFFFYKTFISLLELPVISLDEQHSIIKFGEFRKFLQNEKVKDPQVVVELSSLIRSHICKPQRLISDNPNYYIAVDLITNTYYICYKELMMIDIDYYKSEVIDIPKLLDNYKNEFFRIYKSRNGIHIFLTSKKMNYYDSESIAIMLDLECDFYYSVYSYLRGFCVRLNKKKGEDSQLYSLIMTFGEGKEDKELGKLVDLHIKMVDVFNNVGVSLMSCT